MGCQNDVILTNEKMADLASAIRMVNDLVARLDRLPDDSDIGTIVLRLDFLNRMLVKYLDIDQEIVNTIGTLHSTLETSCSANINASAGYHPQTTSAGMRGRPAFDISRGSSLFYWNKGSKCWKSVQYLEWESEQSKGG